MDTHKLLTDFASLLNSSDSPTQGSTVESFLSLLDQDLVRAIRRSAIPHEVTPTLLRILIPELTLEDAKDLCEKIGTFSFVIPEGDRFSFHDQTRQELFEWWLTKGDTALFGRLSMALVAHYAEKLAALSETDGAAYETALRKRMYHMLGANQADGFKEFERLMGRARYQRRFSECAALARLVHDYDIVLTPEHKTWLIYHEGKLAADRSQTDLAEQLFEQILDGNGAPPLAQAAALMRIGNLKHRAWKLDEAESLYGRSLAIAESHESARSLLARLKHDLGVVCRDRNDYIRARTYLLEAQTLSKQQGDHHIYPTILNSLGRLYTNLHQYDKAINSFTEGLAELEARGEGFEVATVASNLANAHLEKGNYDKSYELYERSLKLSKAFANTIAQAEALNNLARVLRAQHKLEEAVSMLAEASALFLEKGAKYRAGVALQNKGRCCRSLKQFDLAEKSFHQAGEFFRQEGAAKKLAEVEAEIRSLHSIEKEGIPWWIVAVSLAVAGLILLVIIAAILG